MFQAIYEVFGINPFFSENMAQFLAGVEDLCGEPYSGMPLYTFYGLVALGSAVIIYIMKYHWPFDRANMSSTRWWWISAVIVFVFNFLFAIIHLWTLLSTAVLKFECEEDFIKVISKIQDIGMVAIVHAVVSVLLFTLISWLPLWRRWWSRNCFNLTPIPSRRQ